MVTYIAKIRKRKRETVRGIGVIVLLVLLVGGFIGLLVFNNVKLYQRKAELTKQADVLQAEVAALQERGRELEQGIAERQSPEYQERILREQGLYKKPGEEVFTVLQVKEQQQEEETAEVKWWDPRTWF